MFLSFFLSILDIMEKKDIKFIAQGTYGCVFHSKIDCVNEKIKKGNDGKDKFVSKVQLQDNDLREIEIGKKIQEIIQYETFYAPILNTCPIEIGLIDENEINKCDVVRKNQDSNSKEVVFMSSTLRYAGKLNVREYLETKMHKQEVHRKCIFETHLHLLKGLNKLLLLKDPIMHYDLKDNNIIMDKVYNVPIIIDFGLSFTKSQISNAMLNPKDLSEYYYIYYNNYSPWAIEILLLSYITRKILKNTKLNIEVEKIDKYIVDLLVVVKDYTKTRDVFESEEEKIEFSGKMTNYLNSFKSKTIRVIMDDLQRSWNSWDNYAIASMYLELIINIKDDGYISKYKEILKNIVLVTPERGRQVPMDTYDSIVNLTLKVLK